jgi:NAD(P)H-hydrate epimerase
MRVITHREMRIIDMNAAYLGVSLKTLMEKAGEQIFKAISERMSIEGKSFGIFCGPGNNGGDGFVLARYLKGAGAEIEVVFPWKMEDIHTPEARANYDLLAKDSINVTKELKGDYDVVVDALLGTGIKGELREPARSAVRAINGMNAHKISVDVPTGMGSREGVKPDFVIAVHRPKVGLEAYEHVVVDIGIPRKAETHVGPGDVVVNIGARDADSKKGDHGRVLVVGGSQDYYGAPLLTAFAAQNSGADLVFLSVPEVNFDVTRCYSPDLIVRKYPGDFFNHAGVESVLELSEACDSLVIGPGLGTNPEVREAVVEVLREISIPAVVDADALKALSGVKIKGDVVLTPHSGEFEVLTGGKLPSGPEERVEVVKRWSRKIGAVVLLKSPTDVIASPSGDWKFNATGNPGMTAGGTGDVLAGLVGGLIAQGMNTYDAACCAAFINGCAGDDLYSDKGYGFTAMDLALQIPFSLKDIMDFASPKH